MVSYGAAFSLFFFFLGVRKFGEIGDILFVLFVVLTMMVVGATGCSYSNTVAIGLCSSGQDAAAVNVYNYFHLF